MMLHIIVLSGVISGVIEAPSDPEKDTRQLKEGLDFVVEYYPPVELKEEDIPF